MNTLEVNPQTTNSTRPHIPLLSMHRRGAPKGVSTVVRGASLLAPLIAALAVGAISVPAAEADSTATSTVTAVRSGTSAGGASPADAVTITCTLQQNNPHESTHVPGTVNAIARVDCTAPVASLNISSGIYLSGLPVAANSTGNAGLASASVQVNTTQCINGSYVASGDVFVVFPPGFTPQASLLPPATTPAVPIVCS